MIMVQAQGAHWFNDDRQISGNVFYRRTKPRHLMVMVLNSRSVSFDGTEVLIEADEDELEDAGLLLVMVGN
jgi:hypothetical protein